MLSENKIHHYLDMANNACYYSDNHRARLGCVITYKNKILSVGWNLQDKEHPLQKQYNKYRNYDPEASTSRNTIHAECHALIRTKNLDVDWSKANIFVYRIKKDGSKGLAKPCPACEAMIKAKGIKNIFYSTENGYGYEKIE